MTQYKLITPENIDSINANSIVYKLLFAPNSQYILIILKGENFLRIILFNKEGTSFTYEPKFNWSHDKI
jgi:hypothetical protein